MNFHAVRPDGNQEALALARMRQDTDKSFTISRAETAEEIGQFRTLLEEYAASLDFDLGFQDFTDELSSLPGKYEAPAGAILLARAGGETAGCIALHPLSDSVCEMKRLYVRDGFRGRGVGKTLVQKMLLEAKRRNYRAVRLDTLPSMREALSLYESLGFSDIPPYVYNPFPDARYLELKL